MGITVTALSELSIADVQQNHDLLRQIVQEDNPTIDVRRGPFDDLIDYYGGALATVNQVNIRRQQMAQSLTLIQENPELADDDLVDAVLSRFGVTRRAGSEATGSITIVVSKLASVTIANGALFTASGKQFIADQAYVARTSSANTQSATDRVLTPLADGTYAFTIEATAVDVGEASRLSKDTVVIPATNPINFVKAYATSDFTGGVDTETNAELLTRLQEGVSVKALSGRTTMQATLRDRDEFADVLNSSIIGMGDGEMLRDKHWIWPTSGGGRVDWYVRTQDKVQLLALTKQATLIEKTSDNRGIWQFSLGRDEAPGFYEVASVRPTAGSSAGSYFIDSDTRSYDLTGSGFIPDIVDATEAAYSRYQTGTIRFIDTDTDTTSLAVSTAKQDYSVTVRMMPLIADIQTAMGAYMTRNTAGDLLVKAPVPCFLRLSCVINLKSGQSVPDTAVIADNLAEKVNQYGFTGRLPASVLTDVVQNALSGVASVSAIDMQGRIRRPNGTIKYIRSNELLVIPDEPSTMTTARTVAFLLDPSDVAISIQVVDIPEV